MTIPPGTVRDWWNASDEEAEVLVDVSPGRRFELMVTTLWGLGRDGKTNAPARTARSRTRAALAP